MSIVYRPSTHPCRPTGHGQYPRGTISRCDECNRYWVTDGNGRWSPPWPFGPTARRIKELEAAR